MSRYEGEILVIKKEMVQPLTPSHTRSCKMSPSDLVHIKHEYSQKGFIYSISLSCDSEFDELVNFLKNKLANALVYFYPVGGRLSVSNDNVIYIECNDQGAEFVQASAMHLHVHDVLQDHVPDFVGNMFTLNGVFNFSDKETPLLGIQVTRFKDGLVIGVSMNHAIADGISATSFINSWAELCRGCQTISIMPNHDRSFDIEGGDPIQFSNLSTSLYGVTPLKIVVKHFRFSREILSKMKEEAKHEVSSLQCMFAHLWQCVTRARGIKGDNQETQFRTWMNCRKKIKPPLGDGYFGNAIQGVSAKLTARELLMKSFSEIARVLSELMKRHNDEEIRSELESYRKDPWFVNYDIKGSDNLVAVAGSPWFPMYEHDFGFGRPVGLRSGWSNKFSGKMFIFPTKELDGSIDLEVSLEPHEMDALEADPLFLSPIQF